MTDYNDAVTESAREAMLDEYARCVSLYAQVTASADAVAFNEDDEPVSGRHESVCLGCCRMRPDCELVVITDTFTRYCAEQRCADCRALSRYLATGEAA